MQHEQVFIPTDNAGRLSTQRQFQKLVICRVSANSDAMSHFDKSCLSHKRSNEFYPFVLGHVLFEAFALQHIIKFCHGLL